MTPAEDDWDRSICHTCANQYSSTSKRPYAIGEEESGDSCPICLDERQYVPPSGQAWTSWRELEGNHKTELVPEEADGRLVRMVTNPSIGIGQTPFIVHTSEGSIIWDCGPYISASAVSTILSSVSTKLLLGIAISHPHFFGSAVTWARTLGCKVFICARDREWFMRRDEQAQEAVEFWEGDRKSFGKSLTVVRCGGHFPGSCVLHWDRSLEPKEANLPTTGVVFCSDTFMIAADRAKMSFMYSYPNSIPLPPQDVLDLWRSLRPFAFDDIYGAWPGNICYGDGRAKVIKSARRFVEMEGWSHGEYVFEE